MGTRSVTEFHENGYVVSAVYRHWDGYPEGAGKDLMEFLQSIKDNLRDTRFYDASYLSARYLVWRILKENELRDEMDNTIGQSCGKPTNDRFADHPCNFLGYGIVPNAEWVCDREYTYVVNCSELDADGMPQVTVESIYAETTKDLRKVLSGEEKLWEDEEDE